MTCGEVFSNASSRTRLTIAVEMRIAIWARSSAMT